MNTSITKPTPVGDANPDARPVKDVIEPAKAVLGKVAVSVQTALDEMQAQGVDSALVTNQRGELLGTVSSNEMNRKVGGFGHDPKKEPVEAQVEKKNVYCFEDQTVAQAEQIMCDAKVAEVPVVTREKLLAGTTNLEAIAQDNDGKDPRTSGKKLYSKKTFFAVFVVSGGLLLAYALLLRRYSVLRLDKVVG
jgi:CBS domain-containing protein